MLLGFLHCLILPHRPNRRRVHKAADETCYSRCHWCGAKLRRIKRAKWVRTMMFPEGTPE